MRKLFITVLILLVVGTVAAAKMKAPGYLGHGLGTSGARDDQASDHQTAPGWRHDVG
jgi:hypothetical protein